LQKRPTIVRSLSHVATLVAEELFIAGYSLLYRALLQKRPIILRSLSHVVTLVAEVFESFMSPH